MYFRIILFLLLGFVSSFAQSGVSEQTYNQTLEEVLAKRTNGKTLFERSEVYRKSVLREVSQKLKLGTEFQAASHGMLAQQVKTFSGDVSNDDFGQEEPTVAVSRFDPATILIASNDEISDKRSMPLYLTTDAGVTWTTSRMALPPIPYSAWCDPVIVADEFNGFYYAYLINNDKLHLSNIFVAHFDGKQWVYGDPVIANKPADASVEDKESIAVDLGTNSATITRLYIAWSHQGNDPSQEGLHLAWSDDHGLTWSQPVRVDSGAGFYSQVKCDVDGNVFFTFSEYHNDGKIAEHLMAISYDHGKTFVRRHIADYYDYPFSKSQYAPTLKGAKGFRAFPYIVMDYQESANTMHLVYGSYEKASDTTSFAQLYYMKSSDQGVSWSHPIELGFHGDSASLHTDRFMPWIGVDQTTGNIHIVYYSSEEDPKNIRTAAYRAIIYSDGVIKYDRLSDSLFDPMHVTDYTLTPVLGDYIGCSVAGATFAYTWTEGRKGLPTDQFPDGEIYASVTSTPSGVPSVNQVSANALAIFSTFPNPLTEAKLHVGFAIPRDGLVVISVVSIDGTVIRQIYSGELSQGTYRKEFELENLKAGEYFLSLTTPYGSVQKKIIVHK